MLPPTVCMALGCEAPDLNRVLGYESDAVFLDGSHGSPDLRISDHAVGIVHLPTVQGAGEGEGSNHCFTPQLPHTLFVPAAKRTYKGTDEVFAGLIYQELEEHKAFCILHKPFDRPGAAAEEHGVSAVARDSSSLSSVNAASGLTDATNEHTTTGASTLDAEANFSCTTPLTILADGQDMTRFHVCLSSPGIQTVVDGVSYLDTLLLVDALSHQRIPLKPVPWLENDEIQSCSQQNLTPDDSLCKKGRIECGVVASHISPSQWDFLASSDCLVAAVAICEKKRLQLATASHLRTNEQVADGKIMTLHKDCRRFAEEQKVEDGIGERGNVLPGLIGTLGSHQQAGSKHTLVLLPDVAYLMETVVPVLYPALEAVLRDRPEDPLAYLAFYLLRHSTGYSRTATALQDSGAI
ncbi:Dpy-30 motif containing protein, putative [Eimeria praecox]|uniref:Dpy-30 motif containing protein, putative n=1 Tax=Eimeria praecox TaxID=51316 RepID=U6G9W9_9EIME|nr:Dpy-30 motif containing protein, putative [Eimeria praecox]